MCLKYAVEIGDSLWTSLYDAVNTAEYSIHGVYEVEDQKFAVLQNLADEKFYRVNFSFSEEEFALAEEMTDITESYSEESHFSVEAVAEYAKKKKEEEEEEPEDKGEEKKPEEDEKPEDAALQIISSIFSTVQVSVNLADVTEEIGTMLKFWMTFMKEHDIIKVENKNAKGETT